MRTAESVVFTDCPPGPLERKTSTWRSFGEISMSTSSASTSAVTVATLVWMRPWLSVTGTRCTRCGPASCLRRAHASSPLTTSVASRTPPMSDGWRRQDLDLPAVALRERLVHLQEICREQVRLFSAFGAADLEDDVLAVVGIARDEQLLELCLELGERRLLLRDLGRHVGAHVAVGLVLEELARVGDLGFRRSVRAIGVDDRLQLRVATPGVARRVLIAGGVHLRQARLELLELDLEVAKVFEHTRQGRALRTR